MKFNVSILVGILLAVHGMCFAADGVKCRDDVRKMVKMAMDLHSTPGVKDILQDIFYYKVSCNDLEVVEAFLEYPDIIDVNGLYEGKFDPLSVAIAKGHLAMAEKLIKSGANVNVTSINKVSILWEAVRSKNKDAVALLLKHGAQANHVNQNGATALAPAVLTDDTMVQLLIDYGADINAGDPKPLMVAAELGSASMVAYLLHNKADVNAVNKDGLPALASAIRGKRANVVEMLIDAGADVHISPKGITMLMACACSGHVASAQILIKHGLALDLQDELGFTALMHAAMSEGSSDMLEFLLEQGADPLASGHDHHTSISCAFLGPKQELKRRLKAIFRHVPKSYRPTIAANPQKIAQTNDAHDIRIMQEALREVAVEQLTFTEKCTIGLGAIVGAIGAYYLIKYVTTPSIAVA